MISHYFSPQLHQSTAPFKHLQAPFPARTTLQVAALPFGAKVQIDATIAVETGIWDDEV